MLRPANDVLTLARCSAIPSPVPRCPCFQNEKHSVHERAAAQRNRRQYRRRKQCNCTVRTHIRAHRCWRRCGWGLPVICSVQFVSCLYPLDLSDGFFPLLFCFSNESINALHVEGIDFLLAEGADLSRVDVTRALAVLTAAQEANQQSPASAEQSQLLQSAQRAELVVTRFQRAQAWDRNSNLQTQLAAYKQKTELQLVKLRYDLIITQRAREVSDRIASEAKAKVQQQSLKLQ